MRKALGLVSAGLALMLLLSVACGGMGSRGRRMRLSRSIWWPRLRWRRTTSRRRWRRA